jgi:GTP-binding protein Era
MSAPPDAAGPSSRCGFVALLGAPNAGKSTLLNRLVGAKVAIVTRKVQTTRARLRGIAARGDSQIVFVDTPGIFAPKRRLERAMVAAAWTGARDADLIALVFDANRGAIDPDTRLILDGLKDLGRPAILVLNKIDLVKRPRLLELAARFEAEGPFDRTFMISAETGDGVEDLMDYFAAAMPAGPWHYPADQLSDLPLRLMAAEATREKLFERLHDELPYALTVETERWQDFDDGSVKIEQTIYLQRDTHKVIVIGKAGSLIKEIRKDSQKELEDLLERKVHLFLFVKVRRNWLEDPERYRHWGLDFEA